ncbi:MAG: spermidine synthase [Planctomycetes bacterium]|nr:spermidine synthase [Planctomycetota bacterium]
MIPQEHLATATIPGQDTELRLYRHDKDYMFLIRGKELMSSRIHGSEELLAELAIESIDAPESARVLVGGLGMGFTLSTLLGLVGPNAEIEVVELVPEVVAWNREWLGELNGHPLDDPRVAVFEGDVVPRIRAGKASYDAILLDVDNGPEGLVRPQNDRLYNTSGLANARQALRPGGVLAIWSSMPHEWFTDKLRHAKFQVDEKRVRARRTKGPRRTIWIAKKPARR